MIDTVAFSLEMLSNLERTLDDLNRRRRQRNQRTACAIFLASVAVLSSAMWFLQLSAGATMIGIGALAAIVCAAVVAHSLGEACANARQAAAIRRDLGIIRTALDESGLSETQFVPVRARFLAATEMLRKVAA